MFDWLFNHKKKQAAAEYDAELNEKIAAKQHEALLAKRLADRLRNYKADEDDSVSNFSEIDFEENDKTIRVNKGVDIWEQANPGDTSQWKRENRRNENRRQEDRRQADRRLTHRRKDDK